VVPFPVLPPQEESEVEATADTGANATIDRAATLREV